MLLVLNFHLLFWLRIEFLIVCFTLFCLCWLFKWFRAKFRWFCF